MPLEISEISVRLTVDRGPAAGGSAAGRPPAPRDPAQETLSAAQVEVIVDRCVREVLRTLRLNEAR
jgi:hypothetical protein